MRNVKEVKMYKPFERVERAFKSIENIIGRETYISMFGKVNGYARHLIRYKQDYLFDVEVFEDSKTVTSLDLKENEVCYLIHYEIQHGIEVGTVDKLYYITKYKNGKFWGSNNFTLQYNDETYPNTVAVIHVKECNNLVASVL